MKFQFRPEFLPLVFIVLIIVFIVIGIIYSSAIRRNIFCAGPLVFLPTCDLSMLVLPELNEPVGSICQSDKQCNGFRRGVKCCRGVCVMTGCETCDQFCRVQERSTTSVSGNEYNYFFRPCGRRPGKTGQGAQPCILDTDCVGFGELVPGQFSISDPIPGPAIKRSVCCGGVCRTLDQISKNTPGSRSVLARSCKNFCRSNRDNCFNYACRI